MSIKKYLKYFIEKITKTRIYRYLPRGIDPLFDIHQSFSHWYPSTILDIGACTGKRALEFATKYSKANIYCFEPESNNFKNLTKNLKGAKNIFCFEKAVSDKCHDGVLILGHSEDTHKLQSAISNVGNIKNSHHKINDLKHRSNDSEKEAVSSIQKQAVDICTLDSFADEMNLNNVQYLKIDTEGHDLKVIVGAGGMIRDQKIDFIEVEVGMNPDNVLHVPFEKMKHYLEMQQYRIFGIYEQAAEWPSDFPNLRRINAVFVSNSMLNRNQILKSQKQNQTLTQ